jgi:quinol monooxygenase YgiN
MIAQYGFNATLTARPGMGDRLVDLLLTGLDEGSPGASEHCVVYLVSRSASAPDVVHVTEGWTSAEAHTAFFATGEAQALVAALAPMLAGESRYSDEVPVGGKADFEGKR